jgi:uncharacterized protein involved in exopolysaccharide biosynthesis
MRAFPPLSASVARRTRRLWRQYGVFWLGAIAVGLVAVLYARLIDFGYNANSAPCSTAISGCRCS